MRIEWIDRDGSHVDDDGKRPRKKRSNSHDDADEKAPWLVYRPGKGYFWGPKHPKAGESAVFGVYGS